MNHNTDFEHFIKLWQSCNSVGEVADKLGRSRQSVSATAFYLKLKGIPLKQMRKYKQAGKKIHRRTAPYPFDETAFIKAWNAAETPAAFGAVFKMTVPQACLWATRLRSYGFRLKIMHLGRRANKDFKALAALVD